MRLFVAVETEKGVQTALSRIIENLRKGMGDRERGTRFVRPESSHLTMAFLGEVGEKRLPEIIARLDGARRREPFALVFGGLSGFPKTSRARVAWAGVRSGAAELVSLAGAVRKALSGFVRESGAKSPFVPHLTLCRFSAPRDLGQLEVFRLMQETELGTLRVMSFVLMSSNLRAGGSVYEVVHRFALEAENR